MPSSKSREVLASAGVDLGELKTFFKSHKRRSSAVGLGVLQAGPLLSPEAAVAPQARAATLEAAAGWPAVPALGSSVGAQQAVLAAASTLLPLADVNTPVAGSGAHSTGRRCSPEITADDASARGAGEPSASPAAENASPNVGSVHPRDASDDGPATGSGGSSKKVRRKRRQSFSLREIHERIQEIAESGASPLPPKHGMPSPMVPMTPLAGPSLADELSAAGGMEMEVEGERAEHPQPSLRPQLASPHPDGTPAAPARVETPASACTPCVDLEEARQSAPLRTCELVVGHVQSAARHGRLGSADGSLRALVAAVREVSTFAELWHWEEESRLAVRAADDARACTRRVRFCAMAAASLEPAQWSDDGAATDAHPQHAALHALLPALRACDELHAALARVPEPKRRRFLNGAAALVRADARLASSGGAGAFWADQFHGLASGGRLYAARSGALVRSLVRHELRALAQRNEAGEADALRALPSPRAGPVLRAECDSVARLLSNALRVWEASRHVPALPDVAEALGRADGAEVESARARAALVRAALPAELLLELLAAADAHAALSHLVLGCPFVRAAAADEGGQLRQLLELAPLVPGWIDEFALLRDVGALDAELERARAVCGAARRLFPRGAAADPESDEEEAAADVVMAAD